MPDFYCDGHFIAASSPESAVAETEALYGFRPDIVRPWRDSDEDDQS